MPDFKNIAAQAKADHDARISERDRRSAAEAEEKARMVQAGKDRRRAEILPLLDTAKKDFSSEGLDSRIVQELDGPALASER